MKTSNPTAEYEKFEARNQKAEAAKKLAAIRRLDNANDRGDINLRIDAAVDYLYHVIARRIGDKSGAL